MRQLRNSAFRALSGVRSWAGLGPVLAAVLGGGGCVPREAAPTVDTEHKSLVQLELTYSRELGQREVGVAQAARLDAEAHFVRYRAADRAVDERVVAGLLGFSRASSYGGASGGAETALDACAVERGTDSLAAGALEVALLDAGPLSIRSDDALLAVLQPHAYPDLLQFVTGVVYSAELTLPGTGELAPSDGAAAAPLLPAGRVEIEAQGGEDVGPFLAGTRVPAAFPELRTLLSPRELELSWQPSSSAGAEAVRSAQPGVVIELRWSGERPGVVRCRALDDGRFVVPRGLSLDLDTAIRSGDGARVSVARSERSMVEAPGAGPGQVIVTLRDVAALADLPPR